LYEQTYHQKGAHLVMASVYRELQFLLRQNQIKGAVGVAFLLSVFAVWSGISEINTQLNTIKQLQEKDQQERSVVLNNQSDYGSAAYYSFHFTYFPPSSNAFVSIGQRDVFPWKHRIRMLAIEGQIYESDAANPVLALFGHFDYAFLVSALLPLLIILLMHDLRSSEKAAGRFDLLIASANNNKNLWHSRSVAIGGLISIAILIPLWIGAGISNTVFFDVFVISLITVAHCGFWVLLANLVGNIRSLAEKSSATIAATLLSIWLVLTVVIPATANTLIETTVASPNGGDILLTQREAVNDAWDLPKPATWTPFLARHPEWKNKTAMNSQFEWKWYYAFQQVGDQKVESLSQAYQQARLHKNSLGGYAAFLSPSMLTDRMLSRIAGTDIKTMLSYEQSVRNFHQSLRAFYYPYLFNDIDYSQEAFKTLPVYIPPEATQ
jgi:ABC-2 type transport system permease protein